VTMDPTDYSHTVFFPRPFRVRRPFMAFPFDALPLLDLALLLVFFFMIQGRFVMRPGIRVDLPAAPFTGGVGYEAMVVTLSQEGLVFFNDERTTLEGLASAFAQAAHQYPGVPLLIEADGRTPNSTIIEVLNMAMRAGIRNAALATSFFVEGDVP